MSTFVLSFGAYSEPSFLGMTAKVRRSAPYVDGTGNVSQVTWTVTIAQDGTASLAGLPYNDDGTTYSVEWQALSFLPTPGNKTFSVPSTAGSPVDYDTLQTSTVPGVSIPGGVTTANLDAKVAALLADHTSQSFAAALNMPTVPNG